ncbi:MAG: SDR family NAD(P)-dependent oxidoreductase [Campylobacterota bacterium]|nr:SDR family NAD(P)-dependent oxidoreductase [Campylobacterota bacterium]
MKILITGASSGLGAELARQYAKGDNELILLARRGERLLALKKELISKVKDIRVVIVDVTKFELLQEEIKKIGVVDMVILNAGVSLGHSNKIPTVAEFQNLYSVNIISIHAILEILLPLFQKQQYGKIVFISSLASLFTMPSSKVYSSSKRALNAYAQGIRYKYKKDNIKVINILPGFIKSELTDKNRFSMPFILTTQEGVEKIVDAIEKEKRLYAFPLRAFFIISLVNLLPQRVVETFMDKLSLKNDTI